MRGGVHRLLVYIKTEGYSVVDGGASSIGCSLAAGSKKKKDKEQGRETQKSVFHELSVRCIMIGKGDQKNTIIIYTY